MRPDSSANGMNSAGLQAAYRVDPAHQRFRTDDAASGQIDQRLIVQDKFLAFQRALKVALQLQALVNFLTHVG